MAHQTGLRPHELTFGSLFKVQFAISMVVWLGFGILLGLLALAGMDTVSWNGGHVHGVGGLILGLVISLVLGAVLGALGAVFGSLVVKILGPVLPIGPLNATRPGGSGDAAAPPVAAE